MKAIITNPFFILVICIIAGSFFIFNNDVVSDGSTPIYFHGSWALIVGALIYSIGIGYLTYSVYKSSKK